MNTNLSIKTLLASFFTSVEQEVTRLLGPAAKAVVLTQGFLSLAMTFGKDEVHLVLLTDEGMKLVRITEKNGSQPVRRTLSLDSSPTDIAKHLIAAL